MLVVSFVPCMEESNNGWIIAVVVVAVVLVIGFIIFAVKFRPLRRRLFPFRERLRWDGGEKDSLNEGAALTNLGSSGGGSSSVNTSARPNYHGSFATHHSSTSSSSPSETP